MMRIKQQLIWQLVIGISLVLFLSTFTSAISVKSQKARSTEKVKFLNDDGDVSTSSETVSDRQGLYSNDEYEHPVLNSRDLVKKSQNVSEDEDKSPKNSKKEKESSPAAVEVGMADNSDEDGERLAKADRETRGDKSPRIYYDDATPRSHPHDAPEGSPFEHSSPEGKEKDEKLYFPKHYLSSKLAPGPKKGHSPSLIGLSGKRIPDHVHFDVNGHPGRPEYPAGHSHSHHHPVIGHHEEHHELGTYGAPYSHGIEEHHGKGHEIEEHYGKGHGIEEHYGKGHGIEEHYGKGHGIEEHYRKGHGIEEHFGKGHGIEEHHERGHGHHHHTSGYGYNNHYGDYRHTLGDKVDAVGKALKVLLPSALLLTGVSALFPNRIHVPTTPNKFRQKRSVSVFRRRVSDRGMIPSPGMASLPSSHIPPELEDIPSHILRAEHRIMGPADLYPEYGKRYASSSENAGFNPFKVFKGPGPEAEVNKIQHALPVFFPDIPDMHGMSENSNEYLQNFSGPESDEIQSPPSSTLLPGRFDVEVAPPKISTHDKIIPQISQVTTNLDVMSREPIRHSQTVVIRRRKITRKPPMFMREASKIPVQSSSESQKSQYLVKNTIDMSKQVGQEKAEQEFMSSLQNLVTPEIAKAIVENKQEPPKDVDLSPDGPVMGLLTSYAQHENDTPNCQKRALCELAVQGKNPKSTKFEAFLWSVATLVPDVFSEMYDLQEVFQGIRDENCSRFECAHPNLDIQV